MAKFDTRIVVHRPAAAVFASLLDFENYPKWSASTIEAKQVSTGPVNVGTTIWLTTKFLGRRYESTIEVTECEQNKRFALKSTSGPLPFTAIYILEPAEVHGTQIDYIHEITLSGVLKVLEPMIAGMSKRQMETSLNNLKQSLEVAVPV